MTRFIKLFIVFIFCAAKMQAQDISNKGKEFWVGYGHHQFMENLSNTQEMVIYLSAEQPAVVKVSIDSSLGNWSQTFNIPANTVVSCGPMPKAGPNDCRLYDVPISFGGIGGEGVFRRKGIHIESDVPIVAYAHIYGSASSGASMLTPIESWGYQYITVNSDQVYANNCFSWFYVIAQHDSTMVEITPSVPSVLGRPANVPFTVMLMKGQIYQYTAAIQSGSTGYNASGSKIKSIANISGNCYPVAVFAGSSRTTNPATCGSGGGDNDNQQCFPTQAWGKRYLTAPTSSSTAASTFQTNNYRILVKDPATVVKRNGVVINPATLINNSYYKFESNTGELIEGDKPIMVAQHMTGGGCLNGGVGDPEMIYLSSMEQAINRIGFYRNNRESITTNYLTMVVPTAAVASVRIDGSPTIDHSYVHPRDPAYTVVIKRWGSAQAQCIVTCDSAFTAITYGLGSVESYGYNAGTYLKNLNVVGSIRNPADSNSAVTEHQYTCQQTPVKISAFIRYKPTSLTWRVSQVGPNISPNTDVVDPAPVPVDSSMLFGVKYYKYSLPGTYVFSDTGTYTLPILSSHPSIENCYFTETISFQIKVKARPNPNFSFTPGTAICELDTIQFTGAGTTLNSYTVQQFRWTFPGPVADSGQTVRRILPAGANNVTLRVVTTDGCVSDTTQVVNTYAKPVADFSIVPTAICQNGAVTLTDNSTYGVPGGLNNWYWDFGNGNTVNAGTNAAQNPVYPGYGNISIKHVVKVSNTCISDTVTKILPVWAKPFASFSFPTGCLGTNGQMSFTNASTIADGQTLSYAWDFGDASPVDNTTNPTHTFATEGTYNVRLTVSTPNNCTKDTLIAVQVKIAPALNYPALAAVCESTAPFPVANATVTNGVTGTGIYRGPGTNAAGNFDPAAAGFGTHTIWYVFTTNGGCKDSVSQTILVHARPFASFTFPGGCLPNGQITFTNASTIADGQTLGYVWDFGDASPTQTTLNPTHTYTAEGTYNVRLTVSTPNGCTKDTTVSINVKIGPTLNYPVLTAVCQSAAPVSVATATVTNGLAGTGSYRGPGTSVAGLFDPAVAGAGTHTIWYIFTTNGGCKDSVSQTILVRAKPFANFTYPNTCLPVTGQMGFTNASTISDVQSLSYVWDFGGGNTSTQLNPSFNFTAEGTFPVHLTVNTNYSCTKDTIINVPVKITPAVSFATALAPICESAATFTFTSGTVTNGIAGTGIYRGPGTSSGGVFDPAVAGPGTHTIWYIFTTNGGCKDSASETILVRAKPVVDFSFPSGCLPSNGSVTFTNLTTVSDGQTLNYTWDFGDASPTSSSPTHNYAAEGTYSVKLIAVTNNTCNNSKTINVPVKITPALNYPALTPVCASVTTPFSIATATVTNGIAGTGIYHGPGTAANGLFTPSAAGAGNHTLWYVFTTNGGCKDSVSQTIQVQPKPVSAFTVNPDVCLGQALSITDNSSIGVGSITSWRWDFGDGDIRVLNNGNPFTKTYSSAGPFTIKLVTVSSNGCTSDTLSKTINVRPLPVASFNMPASVCMPNGAVQFTNNSNIPGNGTLNYTWNFGDGSLPENLTSPSHVYSTIGSYNIRLTATSAFGCIDDSVRTFSAFFDKPVAGFDVNPDTLCQGSDNTFTDLSTAPNSTLQSWKWLFDDGSNSSARNPVKRYVNPGTYNVKLVVTNAVGCVSDTFKKDVVVYLQPVIDAGPSFVVPQGSTIQFNATANDPTSLGFLWTPATGLSSATILKPTLVALSDQTYALVATGQGNCTATDFLTVKILKPVKVPNAFSPNGDGINDTWVISNISDYPGATVEVFNRYGQQVFFSEGYDRPWNGSYKGAPLPLATYYYIINLKNGFKPLNGSITIVK